MSERRWRDIVQGRAAPHEKRRAQMLRLAARVAVNPKVVKRDGSKKNPDIQVQISRAMVERGRVLNELGEHKTSISSLNKAIARFKDNNKVGIQRQVADALFYQSLNYRSTRDVEGMKAVVAASTKYELTDDDNMTFTLALTALVAADTNIAAGANSVALSLYEKVIRLAGDQSPLSDLNRARVLSQIAILSQNLGKVDAATAALTALVSRYGNTDDEKIKAFVTRAKSSMVGV